MRLASLFTTPAAEPGQPPRDNQLDFFGMTHPGKVRAENQDHFLLCTVHPQVVIHATSLPHPESLPLRGQRLATVMVVADGVGGSVGGADASRLATETITRYVSSSLHCYHVAGSSNENEFLTALREAALAAHAAVRANAEARPDGRNPATTLTLGIVVWPWLYVVQVGDSRCYHFSEKRLHQVSRDQTVAQDLVDQGVLTEATASSSPLRHVLSSAIGSDEAMPEVTRVDIRQRGDVILVCSDGLTKHVSNEEIAQRLRELTSAEQVCRDLVQLALDRGGSDNITIVVARARPS